MDVCVLVGARTVNQDNWNMFPVSFGLRCHQLHVSAAVGEISHYFSSSIISRKTDLQMPAQHHAPWVKLGTASRVGGWYDLSGHLTQRVT